VQKDRKTDEVAREVLDPMCLPFLNSEVRVEDNVRAQYKLVTEKFGIRKLKLVIGWAMGAGQAFQLS